MSREIFDFKVGDKVTVLVSPPGLPFRSLHGIDYIQCGMGYGGNAAFYHRVSHVQKVGKTFVDIPKADGFGKVRYNADGGMFPPALWSTIVPFDPSHKTIMDAYSPGFNIIRHILVGEVSAETMDRLLNILRESHE